MVTTAKRLLHFYSILYDVLEDNIARVIAKLLYFRLFVSLRVYRSLCARTYTYERDVSL